MTIYCKLCNQAIKSDSGSFAEDTKKVLESLSTHIVRYHKTEADGLKTDTDLLPLIISTYLLITRFARVPSDEADFHANLTANEEWLAGLFVRKPYTN
jgi:hypothetical protein